MEIGEQIELLNRSSCIKIKDQYFCKCKGDIFEMTFFDLNIITMTAFLDDKTVFARGTLLPLLRCNKHSFAIGYSCTPDKAIRYLATV